MAKTGDTSHLRGWKIVSHDIDSSHLKYYESLFTLGNGYLGVRGSHEEAKTDDSNEPMTLIAEVYDDPGNDDSPDRLAPAPNWLCITFDDGDGPFSIQGSKVLSETRTLDMKRGTLTRHVRFAGKNGKITSIISTRVVSQARPHIGAIAYSIVPENYSGKVGITSMLDGTATYGDGIVQTEPVSISRDGDLVTCVVRTLQSKIEIAEAARHKLLSAGKPMEADAKLKKSTGKIGIEYTFDAEQGKVYTLEKIVGIDTSKREADPLGSVISLVSAAPDFAKIERENAAAWRDYWKDSEIVVKGDRFVQTMAHFFVFQLLQAASMNNVDLGLSASIGAKTMSGPGYSGHVFWDTEIYMLPFFCQQYPDIAKSLLMYRYDRLETAKQVALSEGRRGAKFPWESASTGVDTTPRWCPTGWREIHVIADVAFGCWQYYLTTGDEEFLLGPGVEIIIETARYWSTRAERKEIDGGYRYEINEVIGPDENHDPVDNSVFTNAMARWNIHKAMELLDRLAKERPGVHKEIAAKHEITDSELAHWTDVANKIKINLDPATGLYEEFDGYFQMEGGARNIKQADVLLLLYLLPELRTVEIFRKNFDVYYPVTTHGSSLSPGVHVLFALDIGYKDHAYKYEEMTCSIDGTRRDVETDRGLHAASLGGGWSSLVAGFGGVRVQPDHLQIAPDLPNKWKLLEFSMVYQGQRLRFRVEPGKVRIEADKEGKPVEIELVGKRRKIRPGEVIEASW